MEIKETAKDRCIRRLNEIYDNFKLDYSGHSGLEYDNEGAHIAAENVIMDLLYDLSYDDVVDKFEELNDKIGFWYA